MRNLSLHEGRVVKAILCERCKRERLIKKIQKQEEEKVSKEVTYQKILKSIFC
jgi:hypothetical protein